MNWDKLIVLTTILGAIVITIVAMFIFKESAKDIPTQAITGLLGFASGGAITYYASKNKEDNKE